MKISLSAIASSLLLAAAILSFASCQDEDFGFTKEDVLKGTFARNFKEAFGDFPKDFSWDLSNRPRTAKYDISNYNTRSQVDAIQVTDVASIDALRGYEPSWYKLQQGTIDWLNANLKEDVNNTDKGKAFKMFNPGNDFQIIPIYQGVAEMEWDLHIVTKKNDGNLYDYKIWSKSDGLRYKADGAENYTNVTKDDCSLIGKPNIEGLPMIIHASELGSEFFLYLDITNGSMRGKGGQPGYCTSPSGDWAYPGTHQRSDEGMMLALNCTLPTNLGTTSYQGRDEGNIAMIIGCEDADQLSSDWDMNDVVFLIVGKPHVPDVLEYTRKRYMFEDLGNTYDLDFNDIVVDVTEEVRKVASIEGGHIVFKESNYVKTQYATIKHVCGTLPFQVTVGSSTFRPVTDPTDHDLTLSELQTRGVMGVNWDPNVTEKITGWNPSTNNVSIKVSHKLKDTDGLQDFDGEPVFTGPFPSYMQDSQGNAYTIDFPGPGETPLVIAVDQTVKWMDEGERIPEKWWKYGDFGGNSGDNVTVTPGENHQIITVGDQKNDIFSNASNNLLASTGGIKSVEDYYAPKWSQLSSPITDKNSSSVSVSLPSKTSERWQAQIKLNTDVKIETTKRYDFRAKLYLDKPIPSGTMVKLTDGNADWVYLTATECTTSGTNTEYWITFENLALNRQQAINNLQIVFDFGTNYAKTEARISDLWIQEHSGAETPVYYTLSIDNNHWDFGYLECDGNKSYDDDSSSSNAYNSRKTVKYLKGTNASIKAELWDDRKADYVFCYWINEETKDLYFDSSLTVNMNEDKTLKAIFRSKAEVDVRSKLTAHSWRIAASKPGHVACHNDYNHFGDNREGIWWWAPSNAYADQDVYNCELIFDENGKYTLKSNGGIRLNQDITIWGKNPNGIGASDFTKYNVGTQTSTWIVSKNDQDAFVLNLGSNPYFPYLGDNDLWYNPNYVIWWIDAEQGMELVSNTIDRSENINENNRGDIIWHFFLEPIKN